MNQDILVIVFSSIVLALGLFSLSLCLRKGNGRETKENTVDHIIENQQPQLAVDAVANLWHSGINRGEC